jgi:hypothetical protein
MATFHEPVCGSWEWAVEMPSPGGPPGAADAFGRQSREGEEVADG